LWPWLIVMLAAGGRKLARVAGAIIVLCWLYRVAMWNAGGVPNDYLRYAFESRFDNLLVGCLLAIVVHNGIASKALDGLTRSPWFIPPTAGLLIASVAAEESLGNAYHYQAGMTIDAVLIGILLMQLVA